MSRSIQLFSGALTCDDVSDEDPFTADCHYLVGGDPGTMGPWQLNWLLSLGLHADSSLLDLGCGTLRGGLHFIRFLAPGRYHGADPHPELLALGAELVLRAGLTGNAPELLTLEALDASRARYDWILTQSVLNHLDEQGLIATVSRVARLLMPDGRWASTIRFDERVSRVEPGRPHGRRPQEYWRSLANPSWLEQVLAKHGLYMQRTHEPRHPRGMDLFVAHVKASAR